MGYTDGKGGEEKRREGYGEEINDMTEGGGAGVKQGLYLRDIYLAFCANIRY